VNTGTGYRPVAFDHYQPIVAPPIGGLVIVFDDGHGSVATAGFLMMERP
jgi:hypothetical protein